MASSSSSGSGLWRRPVVSSNPRPPAGGGGALRPDVDPPPSPSQRLQCLSFGLIIFLACLQFLPATHFRRHSDPYRSWIPFDPKTKASTESRTSDGEQANIIDVKDEKIHIISWSNCLDLRLLAVLANSTLSSSRFPENVHFHFFIPEDEDTKLSYYKLKVVLPHSNLHVIGQKEVKEKLRTVTPEGELLWPLFLEIIPLIIPYVNPSWNRLIYISPDTIVKGEIEDLFALDLGNYSIAVAEDCSRRLGDYVSLDVLNAIQRTTAKSWVSEKPYDKNSCAPDLSLLLLDASKLEKNVLKSIPWWSGALDLGNGRSGEMHPAVVLALYNKYLKLPSSWEIGDPVQSKFKDGPKILHYDGPKRACSGHDKLHQRSNFSSIWRQYLPQKSEAVLNH